MNVDSEGLIEMIGKLEVLQKRLMEEVLGPAISVAVSDDKGEVISTIELIALADVFKRHVADSHPEIKGILERRQDMVKENIPEALMSLAIDELVRNNLVEYVSDSGGYRLTSKGMEVLSSAMDFVDCVQDVVKRDAFFGWAYRVLNPKGEATTSR